MPRFIGYIRAHTDRAFLFQDHFWHHPDWMPKSQIEAAFDPDSTEVVIEASNWICSKKNIKEFEERKDANGT